ncbi:MAG: hypothetical protein SFW66_07795 [Gammaproteobacteria bacterium]|nr:hypothetical protein [Gammaproteobacteria bacterium]
MTHVRTKIRQAIVTALAGLTTTEDRIFDTQIYPLERAQLPAITVAVEKDNVLSDWSTMLESGVLAQTYEMPVMIRGYAKATETVQDVLDAIALEVIEALKADRTLGGLSKDIRIDDVPEITVSGTGEQPIGMITLGCMVLYRIADNAPDVPLL